MPTLILLLNEGLIIRRLGSVTQATATIWRDDNDPKQVNLPEGRLLPVAFPDQIPLGNGWRLQHESPTTTQVVTQNSLVNLFRDPLYKNSLRLHSFSMRNIGLLDSIATVFDGLRIKDERANGHYGYSFPVLPPRSMAGGTPDIQYYRPLEAPKEQYLLLYDNRFAPGERPDEEPSAVNLYALAQVELDEEHFVFLLRQAIDAAEDARRQS